MGESIHPLHRKHRIPFNKDLDKFVLTRVKNGMTGTTAIIKWALATRGNSRLTAHQADLSMEAQKLTLIFLHTIIYIGVGRPDSSFGISSMTWHGIFRPDSSFGISCTTRHGILTTIL